MPNPEPVWEDREDLKVLEAHGLRLAFVQTADRWTHRLELVDSSTVLACPLEIEARSANPASIVGPVYQEIHPHDLETGQTASKVVLLTGRLFDHQFSAAVCFSVDTSRHGSVIVEWDVADRCRSPITHLAATYQMPLVSGDLTDAGPHAIRWNSERLGRGTLEFLAGPPESVALAEAGRNGTRVQAVAQLDAAGFTQRLRYRWRWSPGVERAS